MSDVEVGSVWTFEENKEDFEVIIEKVVTIDGHIVQLSYTLPSGETIKEVALGYFLRTFRCKDDNVKELITKNLDSALKLAEQKKLEQDRKHSHYHKDVSDYDTIDVYAVCKIFNVQDASGCIQHAIKKLLVSGQRGHKDRVTDLQDAVDTLNRLIALESMEGDK